MRERDREGGAVGQMSKRVGTSVHATGFVGEGLPCLLRSCMHTFLLLALALALGILLVRAMPALAATWHWDQR